MAATLLPALIVCCVVASCGGAGAKENGEVTITIASRDSAEDELLSEIYAQSLEAAGFNIERHSKAAGLPVAALEKGRISGYADHLDSALIEVTQIALGSVPGSAGVAYQEAKSELGRKGLVAFPPTSFARTYGVGVLKTTAEQRRLKTLVDVKKSSGGMSIQGHSLCHIRVDCLAGLESKYGMAFEVFSANEPPPRLYEALGSGEVDAVMLLTTEGRLARGKDWLVLLEDDEHRLPAANALWITSQDVVDEAGPDYEKAILGVQKGLTLEVIRELNARVELEGMAPSTVAAEYLKSVGNGI